MPTESLELRRRRLTLKAWDTLARWFERWCKRVDGKFEAFGAGFDMGLMLDNLVCRVGKGAVELEIHGEDDVRLILIDYPDFPETMIETALVRGQVPIKQLRERILKGEAT